MWAITEKFLTRLRSKTSAILFPFEFFFGRKLKQLIYILVNKEYAQTSCAQFMNRSFYHFCTESQNCWFYLDSEIFERIREHRSKGISPTTAYSLCLLFFLITVLSYSPLNGKAAEKGLCFAAAPSAPYHKPARKSNTISADPCIIFIIT